MASWEGTFLTLAACCLLHAKHHNLQTRCWKRCRKDLAALRNTAAWKVAAVLKNENKISKQQTQGGIFQRF